MKSYFCCICGDTLWLVDDVLLGWQFCARCFVELVRRVGLDARPSDVLRAVADMMEEHEKKE